jgi:beta-glucosidase
VTPQEASAVGINWTFGPMVDIARDARWGRIVEGAGEDRFLGAAMARAQVRGFQGQHLGTPGRVVGSVKHLPAMAPQKADATMTVRTSGRTSA